MPLPHPQKISETIVDFGEPLLSQLDADQPLAAVRSTFEIIITIWNAHVMAMPRWGQPQFLADLQERLRAPEMPPEMADACRTLSQRRLDHFATDSRAVGEWSLATRAGQLRLRCDARAPNNTHDTH